MIAFYSFTTFILESTKVAYVWLGEKMVRNKYCKEHSLITVVGTMAFLLLAGGTGAATTIISCATISEPGEYVLNQSIINSSANTCIDITSSNVIFDGAGYTIDGIYRWNSATQATYDVSVYGVSVNSHSTTSLSNVTVKNLNVTEWHYGIYYYDASNVIIANNNATSNGIGIRLISSPFLSSSNNTLTNNNVISNMDTGISTVDTVIFPPFSYNNFIYHNNFVNNSPNARDYTKNVWDNGYPSGGNYWSDFNGNDSFSGLNQNLSGSDGIGDTPYNISGGAGAQDRYPLMAPYIGTTQAPIPVPIVVTGVLRSGAIPGFFLVGDDGNTYDLGCGFGNMPPLGSRVRVTAIRLFFEAIVSQCMSNEQLGVLDFVLIAPPLCMKGDVGCDGQLDMGDVLFTAQAVAGLRTFTLEQEAAADVNAIHGLDVGDVLFVAQAVAGLRTFTQA